MFHSLSVVQSCFDGAPGGLGGGGAGGGGGGGGGHHNIPKDCQVAIARTKTLQFNQCSFAGSSQRNCAEGAQLILSLSAESL